MKKTQTIEIDQKEIDALTKRLETHSLKEGDYELIILLISTVVNVNQELTKKNLSIKRLKRLFNIQTEKRVKIIPENDSDNKPAETNKKGKVKGHGRMAASCYKNAERVYCGHTSLKAGDSCPDCLKGKLYDNIKDGVFVKITAAEPFKATVYTQEKLRCNLCNKVFIAPLPSDLKYEKYDPTVSAMIALLKYGSGFPFYRIEALQNTFGVPIPDSTQWDIIEGARKYIFPVYEQLVFMAAQREVIHNDDTTMKVLSLLKENKMNKKLKRKGIFTTGIISKLEGEKVIALYYTGRKHAGENITNLLIQRLHSKDPPIQMCDALSRNPPKELKTILSNCLTHGRRKFVDLIDNFPDECTYVINTLAKVYHNDSIARETGLNKEERLSFHQVESGPLMEGLKNWMDTQIKEKKVEPNCGLGGVIQYMQNHWNKLTMFLKVPGVPLDNNVVERSLKKAILHRKNSLFYKTENGAYTGDLFMSLIHTCHHAKVNTFNYLTALCEHSSLVKENPALWLPWNFHRRLKRLTQK